MMAEDDPFVGRLEIVAVAQALGGRGALVVERHHPRGDELGVKAIPNGVGAGRGEHQPQAVDMLPAIERDSAETKCSNAGNRQPENGTQNLHDF